MSCNNDGEEAALRLAGELFAFLKREELKLRSDFFSDDKGIFIKRTKRLWSIFGDVVFDGLRIAESGNIKPVHDEDNVLPMIYEVRSNAFSKSYYYIYPDVNYCKCETFRRSVVNEPDHRKKEFTCRHVLAVWFAKIINKVESEPRIVEIGYMSAILRGLSTPPISNNIEDSIIFELPENDKIE